MDIQKNYKEQLEELEELQIEKYFYALFILGSSESRKVKNNCLKQLGISRRGIARVSRELAKYSGWRLKEIQKLFEKICQHIFNQSIKYQDGDKAKNQLIGQLKTFLNEMDELIKETCSPQEILSRLDKISESFPELLPPTNK